MVNTIQNQKLLSLPSSYMMHAFGSESQMPKKTLTLVATLAGAYFSFQYLPPGIDNWAGGIILVTGAVFLIFGSLAKVFEFVGGFFSHLPPPSHPPTYPPKQWSAHKTPPYHIPSTRLPQHYPHSSPYVPPLPVKNPPRTVVYKKNDRPATLDPTVYSSGQRPRRKSTENKKHHLPPRSGLSQSWNFSSAPSLTPSFGTPVHTKNGPAQVHVGSKAGGFRPVMKKR